MLLLLIHVYWCPTRTPYHMIFLSFNSNTTDATSGAGTANASGTPGSTPSFWWVSVAHLWDLLCCLFCFVCLRHVSCVPNVACFSGFSILDFPFGFLLHLFIRYINCSPLTITLAHLRNFDMTRVAQPILFSFCVVFLLCFVSSFCILCAVLSACLWIVYFWLALPLSLVIIYH